MVNRFGSENKSTKAGYLQAMLDAFPFVAFLLRPVTREIVASNKTALGIGAIPGKKCFATWGRRSDPCPWCLASEVWKTGESRHLEVEALGIVWDAHWVPIAPDLFMYFAFDITERKKVEEELNITQENFRHSLDDSPLGIRILNRDGDTIYANKAILDIYGYSDIDELTATPAKERYTPESYVQYLERKEKRQHGEFVPPNYEISIVRKNGSIRHLEIHRKEVVWNGQIQSQVVYEDITEREDSEEALRQNEKRLKAIVAHAPIGIATSGISKQLLSANDVFCRTLGYSEAELLKMNFKDITHPDDVKESVTNMDALDAGKVDFFSQEKRYIKKDGKIIIGKVMVSAVRDEQRKPYIYVAELEDVTEQKQLNERYKTMVQTSIDGYWILDTYGHFHEVNDAYCRLIGYSREELLKMTISDVEALEKPEDTAKHIQKIMEAGFDRFDTSHRTKNGKIIDLDISVTYQLFNEGVLFVTIRDITQRKLAEEALRASEEKLRLMFESITDSIVVTDLNGQIQDCNETTVRMYGCTNKLDILGRTAFEFIAPRDHLRVAENIKRTLEEGQVRNIEYTCVAKDGKEFSIELSAALLKERTGNAAGFIAVTKDITERKQAEIVRAELEQKIQMASRLATIGEMATGIAHEINNPLTPILGFSEMLLNQDFPDKFKPELQVIYDSAKRAADVTRRLLTFARQTKPQLTTCNLNSLVESTLELRSYSYKTNSIQVIKEFDSELPSTIADGGQLQQVLLNLIINAEYEMLKANDGGIINVRTEKVKDQIRISINDNGPGIPAEIFGKLFSPFFTTKKEGEGTGIGLSICRNIITEHNGKIWAQKSDSGKGATFIIELPIRKWENGQALPITPEVSDLRDLTGTRILVVDDEPQILRLVDRLLSAEGCEVKTANSSIEALSLIQTNEFELVLLDIRLPDMNGIELFRFLEKLSKPYTQKIIFTTGDTIGTDTAAFFSTTGVSYLAKPFDFAQLKQEVKKKLLKVNTSEQKIMKQPDNTNDRAGDKSLPIGIDALPGNTPIRPRATHQP